MAKIDQEIEKLIFYQFGRVERDLENIALRYGLPKGELADRLSALLSTTPNGTVFGDVQFNAHAARRNHQQNAIGAASAGGG